MIANDKGINASRDEILVALAMFRLLFPATLHFHSYVFESLVSLAQSLTRQIEAVQNINAQMFNHGATQNVRGSKKLSGSIKMRGASRD